MIFRLEYKNKALKTARVDIITPTGTGVETVEGTGYPFQLKYEGDKKNKGLMFLSSSAEINIYETPLFNIDTLKTSGEKDIRVNYYIDSVLEWTGFVIPDFFSREIGGDGVVSMVASDRLSVLDSEVLEGLPVTVTLRTLLSLSLAKTGLTLPLKTVVDFVFSGTAQRVLDNKIRSQRLTDTKGRSVNCKDIIKSILVATNSKLMQRKGEWWVINKMQHELGGGRVYTSPTAFTNYVEDLISFTDVTRGAMRTIAPVAGGVGVFQEYGGGKLIPDNYNFKNGLTGWTNYNGFTASTNNRRVLGYTQSGNVYTPIYDVAGTSEPYLVNRNLAPFWVLFPPPSLGNIPVQWDPYAIRSTRIISPVISGDSNAAKVTVDVNAVGRNGTHLPFSVVLKRPGRENLFLNRSNEWQPRAIAQLLSFKNDGANNLAAVSAGMSVSAVITAESSGEALDDVGTYTIEVLIFGSGLQGDNTVDNTTLINSASVQFSAASNDTPKGTLYKADQGGESYTKIHDTETTVFGDYLTGGLNGYFYNYAPDDTSSLLAPNGSRSQPAWVNTFTQNTEPLPLLQQTIRQMRRMFSVAHDFVKGEIDVSDFDPLSIFEDCERRFVIVEAEFDFLRGSLQVVLEEVAYQNLTVREYIYSYFGEGDEGIRGISGISAGSSGGGGGGSISWLEQYFEFDEATDSLRVNKHFVSEGEIAAWQEGEFNSSIFDNIPWANDSKAGGVLASSTFQNGIRINASGFLEVDPTYADSGVSSWSELTDRPAWLSPASLALFEAAHGHGWSQIANKPATATRWPSWAEVTSKPGTFPPAAHTQAISTITGLQNALDNKAAKAGDGAQDFNVKDLIIHGQVNQWLAQQLVVDDARIQVNRKQDGVTVDSGLVIYNKDTSSEVSSLVYDVDGIWRAGGQRIYTDTYKPLADNATNLGGYSAASYPRKAEAAVITQNWTFRRAVSNTDYDAVAIRLFNSQTDVFGRKSSIIFQASTGSDGAAITGNYSNYSSANGGGSDLIFSTKNPSTDTIPVERMRIRHNGDVGIGVSPTERLHVAGNGLFEGDVILKKGNDFTALDFYSQRTSGNLGGLRFFNNNNHRVGHIYCEQNGTITIGNAASGSSVNKLRLTNAGDFDVLSGGLSVFGTSTLTGAVTAGGNVTAGGDLSAVNAALSGSLDVSGASTLTGAVTAGGNASFAGYVSIGTPSITPNRLYVVGNGAFTGNITSSGEVTAYSSSDSRLKQNIKPITSALDIIEGLNPVSYNWNKKAIALNSIKDNIRTNYGVIAQEVEKVLPELVHETNGYKSVDYPQLFGIMLAAIKELKQEINEFKN